MDAPLPFGSPSQSNRSVPSGREKSETAVATF